MRELRLMEMGKHYSSRLQENRCGKNSKNVCAEFRVWGNILKRNSCLWFSSSRRMFRGRQKKACLHDSQPPLRIDRTLEFRLTPEISQFGELLNSREKFNKTDHVASLHQVHGVAMRATRQSELLLRGATEAGQLIVVMVERRRVMVET